MGQFMWKGCSRQNWFIVIYANDFLQICYISFQQMHLQNCAHPIITLRNVPTVRRRLYVIWWNVHHYHSPRPAVLYTLCPLWEARNTQQPYVESGSLAWQTTKPLACLQLLLASLSPDQIISQTKSRQSHSAVQSLNSCLTATSSEAQSANT